MFLKRRLPSFQRCLGKPYKVFPSRERAMGIQRWVSYLRVFWPAACKKWMILQLLNKLSGKIEPQKLFPITSFVRRIYNLIDSGWDINGIFSVYTVWADIATGSVIFLWDPEYCYGLWADETTFAYGQIFTGRGGTLPSLTPRAMPLECCIGSSVKIRWYVLPRFLKVGSLELIF